MPALYVSKVVLCYIFKPLLFVRICTTGIFCRVSFGKRAHNIQNQNKTPKAMNVDARQSTLELNKIK